MKGKGSAATIAIAVLTGVIAAALALWSVRRRPDAISDFDQAIVGARVLFAGGNPYEYIGPGRAWDYLWPLYYPAPALIVARPFSLFSIPVARAAFIGLGMGIFAWALLRKAPHCWPMLLSYPALATVDLIQWTPWLAAALWVPSLGAFIAAKPNIGLAVIAGQASKRHALIVLALAAAFAVASVIAFPQWPRWWLSLVGDGAHVPMVLRPLGFVLFLSALRWRYPEGRLLLALSLTPMTAGPQEGLMFAALPRTRKEALFFAVLSHGMLPVAILASHEHTYLALAKVLAWGVFGFLYLPALFFVMRLRRTSHDASHDASSALGDARVA